MNKIVDKIIQEGFKEVFGCAYDELINTIDPNTTASTAAPAQSEYNTTADTAGHIVAGRTTAPNILPRSKNTVTSNDEEEIDYVEIVRDITEAMTIAEIRDLLERHGLDSGGNKKNLIGRLARALEDGDIELDALEE